jgi:hypothetical protein
MTTQVSFVTDNYLKDQALEKARREGITLKTLLIYAMKAFVEGKISLGIQASGSNNEIEELNFSDSDINEKAAKLAKLLN